LTDKAKEGLATVTYEEGRGFLSTTADIIEDMRNGRMVILVDAEDRENEGDLVIPAQMATPDAINFMAMHGRGLICLSLTEARARELALASMVPQNASRTGTAFTASIEAREGVTTGISAHDRSHTILTAIDQTKGAAEIVSPGHVFPLIARDGGVLVRAGHTEASVDLARMAGLTPAAVICEIMNDDGTMSRLPELVTFAQKHGLKIGTIEDLIAFRLRHDRIVEEVARKQINSRFGGDFDLRIYERKGVEVEHLALVKGNISGDEPVLVRVHAVSFLSDVLGVGSSGDADATKIERAMQAIAEEGRGILVIIRDDRRKVVSQTLARRDDKTVRKAQANERRNVEIGIGSQILRDLGVTDMILLTNSPQSVYVGLEAYGLRVVAQRPIG
jgi:3,4-dihydroxy 2-butanone 4-phosphate synthase/GTP cyclohydrolase II